MSIANDLAGNYDPLSALIDSSQLRHMRYRPLANAMMELTSCHLTDDRRCVDEVFYFDP